MASKGKILKKVKQHKGNKDMEKDLKDLLEEESKAEETEEVTEEEIEENEAEAEEPEAEKNEEAEEPEEEKKDPKDERIEELEDKVKRQLAEFDNFRKRTDKEKETMFEAGAKSVIEKILPVVDNFERGIASLSEEELQSAQGSGMQMIYKQLMGELEKLDVKPIEAVGKEFDPELHNAVMQCESEEYESGIVAQELQKGYTYRDSVIRHSMVAVVS
ncbi:MAG: nucleotide exchange factor GrpE [Lachnospiraceae bacterium]|nr:nucleotide exchange factor GrpE [Lachnospiraceae bacterium]